MGNIMVSPSILSANFTKMGEEVAAIESMGADLLHCDVMDGVFVPNISFGPKMVADVKKITKLPLDVHLMIVNPQQYLPAFIKAGADILSFHIEAAPVPFELLHQIKAEGVQRGLVISPDTPIDTLQPFLIHCDVVTLMSVYPGFSGQKFLQGALQRLSELKTLRDRENPHCKIEIDGGITLENIDACAARGAQIAVAGNAVFAASDPAAAISYIKKAEYK